MIYKAPKSQKESGRIKWWTLGGRRRQHNKQYTLRRQKSLPNSLCSNISCQRFTLSNN